MKLYRFAPDGRYLNFIVQDRPMEEYSMRTDLTPDAPPARGAGQWPYREDVAWVLRAEVEISAIGTAPTP